MARVGVMDSVELPETAASPAMPRPPGDPRGRSGPGRRLAAIAGALAVLAVTAYFLTGWRVRSLADVSLEQAEQFLKERDNARARQSLEWLLWFDPSNDRALLIAGISLNADRRFAEAVALLERIPESSPQDNEAGFALAASLHMDGQWERAEQVLVRYLERFPDSREARERLLQLYLTEFRLRDARRHLERRWSENPEDFSVLPQLVEVESRPLSPNLLVKPLETADAAHPNQFPVVLALARVHALGGRIEPARTRFQQVQALQPDSPETRLWVAKFLLDCGELQPAGALLGPDVPPDLKTDDRFWFVRSRWLEQTDTAESALRDLEKALAMRPNEDQYVLMQAALFRKVGRTEDATRAARRAAQLAEDRKQLWLLSERYNREGPDPVICEAIAARLEALGLSTQAEGWRRVRSLVLQQSGAGPRTEVP